MKKLSNVITTIIAMVVIVTIVCGFVSDDTSNNESESATSESVATTTSTTETFTSESRTLTSSLDSKSYKETTYSKTTKQTTTKTHDTTCNTELYKNSYTDDELYILSHIIVGEAEGCSDDMQLAVGSVVLNRVKSPHFPNTIRGVAFQAGQYACTWDGNYYKHVDSRTLNNAKYLLENGSILPSNVVFQAEFIQGSGVYTQIGNTYFCYY